MTLFALDDAGSGPPLLLVHGFPTTRRLWKETAPRLAAAGLRVLAPDLIGYGDSPDAEDVGMENQARWLVELLDDLGIGQVALIAHDVGTAAAQILTARRPERVRRLVLTRPSGPWAPSPAFAIGTRTRQGGSSRCLRAGCGFCGRFSAPFPEKRAESASFMLPAVSTRSRHEE
jgi:pimeloyl-ACP methyl ester carboxylesterase